MTVPRHRPFTLEHLRPVAAWLLVAVFMGAAQLAPLAHLVRHGHDHTHGPEPVPLAAVRAHHDHDQSEHAPEHDEFDDHHHDDAGDHEHDDALAAHDARADHDHGDGPAPSPTSPDHGRDSAAHFGLAIIDGPPPPYLPPPAETLAPPPDAVVRRHFAPALPQPPVRGPPRSR